MTLLSLRTLLACLLLSCLVATAAAAGTGGVQVTTAALSPEFVTEQAQATRYMIVTPQGTFPAGSIPSPVDMSHLRGQEFAPQVQLVKGNTDSTVSRLESQVMAASRYDLRQTGRLTRVKNQDSCGSCWAFATYGSMESYLRPGETRDFSEDHMRNTHGFDLGACDGGNTLMSTAYLARWAGPVEESDDPYNLLPHTTPLSLPIQKKVQEVIIIPERGGPQDNENLKMAMMSTGAVYSTLLWNTSAYNATSHGYYNSGNFTRGDGTAGGHAIAIVGWDDGWDRRNFTVRTLAHRAPVMPAGNGAFIARNSWGDGWGERGYFYVSYYDSQIGDDNAAFTAGPEDRYDHVYQYDPLGWTNSMGIAGQGDTAWFANVFTAGSPEILSAVSFYTGAMNSEYQVQVHLSPNNGPLNTSGARVTTSGTIGTPGYHTVSVPVMNLEAGQRFSVVVRLRTPGYNSPISVEAPTRDYSSRASASAGESYTSADGRTFQDLTQVVAGTNVCLKAFTLQRFIVVPMSVSFSGSVKDGSGQPIPGIWVRYMSRDARTSGFVKTDALGTFRFTVDRFPASETFRALNLTANGDLRDTVHPRNPDWTSATLEGLHPDQDRPGLDLRLAPTGSFITLSGRVTSPSGAGIPGIWVYRWRQDNTDSGYQVTNETGYYTFRVSQYPATDTARRYNLAANKDNGDPAHPRNPDWTNASLDNVVPDRSRSGLDFRLQSGWVILQGKVTGPSGAGIPDIWVYRWRQDRGDSGYEKTNASGYYRFRVQRQVNDLTRRYNLAANKDNGDPAHPKNPEWATGAYDNVMPDTNRDYLNIRLESGRVTLQGRVVDDTTSKPLSGIWVYFWRHDRNDSGYVQTNSTGYYSKRVDRLFDSGDATRWYNLAANKDNPDAQVNPNYFSAEKNDVKPTYDQTVPDIRLKTAKVKVTGRVTARTGGAGIANVWVYYWRQDNNDSGYVQTNGTGYYTMYLARSLTSSDTKTWYNLAANKDNGDTGHPKNPDWTTADSNNLVPSGDRTGINMVLDSGWVTLSGKVTSPTGAGIPGIWVYYWRQDNNHAGYVGTDGQGGFSIRVPKFLSGDTYRYNLAANKDNGDPDHPKNRDWTTASYDNLMPSTDRPGLTLRLDSGRVTFWGRVKDGSGTYLSGIWVYYWRHDNNDAGYVQTNSTGHYTLTVYKYPYSDDSKWYNLAANKDNGDGKYTNGYETKEIVNVAPDVNRGYKDFTLLSSRVRVTGRVTAQSGGRGLSGIWVYYWRHDGSDADYAVTDGNGYYTMHLLRGTSGNRDSWYNLAANKNNGDPDHPWNPAYAMVEKNDRIPSGDLTVDFPLPSRTG